MLNLKLVLNRKEFNLSTYQKRGRPKRTLLWLARKFISYLKKVYQDNRFRGNKISRVLRRVLEIKKIKEMVGLNLLLVIFLISMFSQPISAINDQISAESIVYAVNEVKITTERAINRPLDNLSISQSYHFLHPAIDLKAIKGTPVYSLNQGKVEKVNYSYWGYGNHLIISSGSFKFLFAHLNQIQVKEGQEVDQNTIVGTIGTSGWTTGPHLHLEIWQDSRPINPTKIIFP